MQTVTCFVLNDFINDNRVLREAISLRDDGYSVTICALHEKGLPEHEEAHAIPVHRVRLTSKAWPKIMFIQFLKYLEFIFRAVLSYRNTDIVHCNDLNTLPVGVLIKLLKRNTKIVYDAHEYEINTGSNQSKFHIRMLYYFEKALISYADRVITVSEGIADEYRRLYSLTDNVVVMNCPPHLDIPVKHNIFRERFDIPESTLIFLYQGGLYRHRGIEEIVEVFTNLNDEHKMVVFMGYGPLKDYIVEAQSKTGNIIHIDAVTPEVLLSYTNSADCGILLYPNSCLSHYYCLPNKLFEYAMAEIPIIASDLYELRKKVLGSNIGYIVIENDVQNFSRVVSSITPEDLHKLHQNLVTFKLNHNWETQVTIFKNVYQQL